MRHIPFNRMLQLKQPILETGGRGGSSLERLDSKYKSLIPPLFLFKIVNRTCESCSSSNTIENVIGELGLHAGSDPPQKKSLRFFIDLAS